MSPGDRRQVVFWLVVVVTWLAGMLALAIANGTGGCS